MNSPLPYWLVFLALYSQQPTPPLVLRGLGEKQPGFSCWVISYETSLRRCIVNFFFFLSFLFVMQVCGGGALDPRAEQCAAFNTQEFMGRLYNWEPFTEGEA